MCFRTLHSRHFFDWYGDRLDLHSFPTRRSSDLILSGVLAISLSGRSEFEAGISLQAISAGTRFRLRSRADRKSTRLNSSHSQISYAVFCLKKKKTDSAVAQATTMRGVRQCATRQ